MTKLQQYGSLAWKKSTASGSGGCVEVARSGEMLLVRDSKNPSGSNFTFSQTTPRWVIPAHLIRMLSVAIPRLGNQGLLTQNLGGSSVWSK